MPDSTKSRERETSVAKMHVALEPLIKLNAKLSRSGDVAKLKRIRACKGLRWSNWEI